jgi:hypothetical protein|tara:strand:- start:8185 stop:8379 length:195 start_codon:yes stop_codon:yes gene_type:complete
MDDDWSVVFSTQNIFKAEIIRNILLTNNINAVLMNQKDSSYLFGTVKIYTKKKDIKKAQKIISE